MKKATLNPFVMLMFLGLLIMAMLSFSLNPAVAQSKNKFVKSKVGDLPVITLKHWQDSNNQVKYAYLVGFANMLELEKNWQDRNKPLPMDKSLVGSWSAGFEGVTIHDVFNFLNTYVTEHLDEMNRSLVEVLWFHYAQPKVKK